MKASHAISVCREVCLEPYYLPQSFVRQLDVHRLGGHRLRGRFAGFHEQANLRR
jgi:hypothetical protein